MQSIGVVISTKNEEQSIGEIVKSFHSPYVTVIVVDSQSTDRTVQEAIEAGAKVMSKMDEGIASAYLFGFERALGYGFDRIIQMDAGFSHKTEDARKMAQYNADLIVGARVFQWWGMRTLVSMSAAFLMWLRGVSMFDVTSGFRVWKPWLLDRVIEDPVQSVGNAFQIELLWRAHCLGAHVYEVPITYKRTGSHFKPWMLVEALKIYGGLSC